MGPNSALTMGCSGRISRGECHRWSAIRAAGGYARVVIPITTSTDLMTLPRCIIRWRALLQPASKEYGLLCQVPIGKNFASHREHGSARAAGVEAALSQPLLVFVGFGVLAYGLFQ